MALRNSIEQISQSAINQMQEKDQALNGWIALDSAGVATATGNFYGIKVLAGSTATVSITSSLITTNGVTISLVEGDYLPTPGATAITVSAGKIIAFKAQQ